VTSPPKPLSLRAAVWDPEGSLTQRRLRNALAILIPVLAMLVKGTPLFTHAEFFLALMASAVLGDLSLSSTLAEREVSVDATHVHIRWAGLRVRSIALADLKSVVQRGSVISLTPRAPGAFSLLLRCGGEAEADALAVALRGEGLARANETFLRYPVDNPKTPLSDKLRLLMFAGAATAWIALGRSAYLPIFGASGVAGARGSKAHRV
jgi:hypothetical protein